MFYTQAYKITKLFIVLFGFFFFAPFVLHVKLEFEFFNLFEIACWREIEKKTKQNKTIKMKFLCVYRKIFYIPQFFCTFIALLLVETKKKGV